VIALGPGYVVRKDCDAVIDTVRGPGVGAVLEDTGERLRDEPPAQILGYAGERSIKAVRDGIFFTHHKIGGEVGQGERIGTVVSVYGVEDFRQGVPVDASYPVTARIAGVLRGLLRDGVPVKQGDRIADIDPRGQTDDLDKISDKAHRVAEGVHEALMGLLAEVAKRHPGPKQKKGRRSSPKKPIKAVSSKKKKLPATGRSTGGSRVKATPSKSGKRGKGTAKG